MLKHSSLFLSCSKGSDERLVVHQCLFLQHLTHPRHIPQQHIIDNIVYEMISSVRTKTELYGRYFVQQSPCLGNLTYVEYAISEMRPIIVRNTPPMAAFTKIFDLVIKYKIPNAE